MLTEIGRSAARWISTADPWTNIYGLSRSLFALSTMLTLAFTKSAALFAAGLEGGAVHGRRMISFSLFPSASPELARWSAVFVLLIVASGWRPRLTGLPHWWISASFYDAAIPVDGGDQIAAVLTLLLLPVCMTDTRAWQWQSSSGSARRERPVARMTARSALLLARVQVAAVYFQALIAKVSVEEWGDGTALYYWLNDPYYGAANWLKSWLMPLLTNPISVTLMTWASTFIELILVAALVMPKRAWPTVMMVGLLFHAAIGITQGLITFSIAMSGALILYLRPLDKPFVWPWHRSEAVADRAR